MSSKIERLINMVLMVIEINNIVVFGSDEHFEILNIFDNMTSIEEVKNIDNKYINEALGFIRKSKRLSNVLKEHDINIDAE